ncbi:MAG: SLBB domain-containing protein [Verrucomicrobia bacterium]|nr:SLBB domain-containing protein [Verrucomicrobiota bacterium]
MNRGSTYQLTSCLIAISTLLGCTAIKIKEGVYGVDMGDGKGPVVSGLKPSQFFTAELKASGKDYSSDDKIDAESIKVGNEYRLGPGDRFAFLVRGREDISREEIIVAPDGEVSLPRVGIMNVQGRTLSELTTTFIQMLGAYYENPEVTLVMKAYNNNRVFVLGRVSNPGAVSFQGPGTLLEALSLAGGLPVDTAKSFLSRCTIVRGKDLVMRIDLKELLEKGNMRLNARLQNGDVIFIPQSDDQLAYVMGEVKSPGVVPLRSELSLLDAIMNAGGPTKTASLRDIFLIRRTQGNGVVERISFQNLVGKADYRRNYTLCDGDMIYVPENGLSKLNYFS